MDLLEGGAAYPRETREIRVYPKGRARGTEGWRDLEVGGTGQYSGPALGVTAPLFLAALVVRIIIIIKRPPIASPKR